MRRHQITKQCSKCQKSMIGCISKIKNKKYCSHSCAMKNNQRFLGKTHSQKTKMQMSTTKIIKYDALHAQIHCPSYANVHSWLRSRYGRPKWCEKCKSTKVQVYDWALKHNKKHQYYKNNYIRLCRKCHHRYDDKSKKVWITRKNITNI